MSRKLKKYTDTHTHTLDNLMTLQAIINEYRVYTTIYSNECALVAYSIYIYTI